MLTLSIFGGMLLSSFQLVLNYILILPFPSQRWLGGGNFFLLRILNSWHMFVNETKQLNYYSVNSDRIALKDFYFEMRVLDVCYRDAWTLSSWWMDYCFFLFSKYLIRNITFHQLNTSTQHTEDSYQLTPSEFDKLFEFKKEQVLFQK